ncbi:MAG: hypothetical protein J6U95_02275 [Alistipes sp.]|nr:hypothetical protein [Alistipes sp.]
MRRYFSLLCILALLVGCYNTDEQLINEQIPSDGRIFTASFEQNDTRTYVEEGNLLRWNAGDQITIFDSNTLNQQYEFDGETGDNGGTFSKVSNSFGTGNDLNCHYAVYPYNKDIKITETGVITANLPAEQSYAENSFGLGANTMVAVTENHNDTVLKFKNVGGYLKLQLYGDDVTVKSIELTGNSNEKIAGKASITPTYNDDPQISMLGDATSCITLNCGEGVKIGSTAENITDFWIVIPPTTFEDGFTITITDINDETFIKSTSNEIAIERNVIKPMKAFEVIFENESEDEGSSNDYIDEYGVNHGPGVEIDGVVWAPVNCGYHATDYPYGKLYQWGRRYGQGYNGDIYDGEDYDQTYSDATKAEVIEGPISSLMESTIQQNTFIIGPKENYYDWLDVRDDYRWNAGTEDQPKRTEYDPCPTGWRVPTCKEFSTLIINHSEWVKDENGIRGIWYSGSSTYSSIVPKIFLSAGGINRSTGESTGREGSGNYWTSQAVDLYNDPIYGDMLTAQTLHFNSSNDGSFSSRFIRRSRGLSIRCVKDAGEDTGVSL